MKNKAYAIWIYATITLLGGIFGFVKTGSAISLISAGLLSLALDISGFFVFQGKKRAQSITLGILACALAFFGYRFFLTLKFMPAGLMIALTLGTIGFLVTRKR